MQTAEAIMTPTPDRILDQRLLRAQAASGAVFSVFLLLHLVNQATAALGAAAYDGTQRVLRRGYQAPVLELALVIGPLLVHAVVGGLRIWRRTRQAATTRPAGRTPLPMRLHRLSALVLLVFFAGHVVATRGASLLYDTFPAFHGIAFTLRWVPAYFWPYYTAFALAGLYHSIYGLGIALPLLGLRPGAWLRRPRLLWPLVGTVGVALILGMLGFGGVLTDVGRPEESPYARLLVRLGVAHR
jgi:succinate dehydrogenase/fumarate reductase cytochrome b subunit